MRGASARRTGGCAGDLAADADADADGSAICARGAVGCGRRQAVERMGDARASQVQPRCQRAPMSAAAGGVAEPGGGRGPRARARALIFPRFDACSRCVDALSLP